LRNKPDPLLKGIIIGAIIGLGLWYLLWLWLRWAFDLS
jgi:hypothetical protein